jgi:acetyl esterase/lipase
MAMNLFRIRSVYQWFTLAVLVAQGPVTTCFAEPTTELLWLHGAPGAVGHESKDRPTLIIYAVAHHRGSGSAIVVCPGGGYVDLAMDHEGHQIAQWLNSIGVSAFILDYRHRGKGYGHPAPLQDAQRAIRTVRARAAEWKIDPLRIGILGFSAGGHLASTAATHFDNGSLNHTDPIERVSSRPDFAILCYPVIAFNRDFTHRGSQRNLLSDNPAPDVIENLSNEKQVTPDTPPTFLFHTNEDTGVLPENSVEFYLALRKANVPAELHIYEKGPHGVGLGHNILGTREWSRACEAWLQHRGLLVEP